MLTHTHNLSKMGQQASSCFSFLRYEHEIGWEVDYQVAGTTAKKLMESFQEPDSKKMNEVWGKVNMRGMHSVKIIQQSEDGKRGGIGTIYENYDKKGVAQNKHKIVHYEVQDKGKSIYTEGVYIWKHKDFPFKLRDKDQTRIKLTDLDNGNVRMVMEVIGVIEMRGFSECCLPLMYPMDKFQSAIQEVMAPQGVGIKVPRGKLTLKKKLTYNIVREKTRPTVGEMLLNSSSVKRKRTAKLDKCECSLDDHLK